MKRLLLLYSIFCFHLSAFSQIDSIAQNIVDTIKSKLIIEEIPHKTVFEKFMYPHRWYIKKRLEKRPVDFDTTYIKTNKRKLTISLPVAKKFYGYNLHDLSTNKSFKVSPNHYYQVGFSLSNLIVTFGVFPGIRFGDDPDKGKTRGVNLQVTVIGRKIITDLNVQNYRSFYTYNSSEFQIKGLVPDSFNVRPDIKLFSFGINTMYVFKPRKYSLRGAFSFADVQRKSAGSFMAGVYHSYAELRGEDTTLVSYPFRDNFSDQVNTIKKLTSTTLGLSIGYGYTYVYKKIIFSNCLNVGMGGQTTNFYTIDDSHFKQPICSSVHVNAKSTLRYDDLRFFSGVLATYENNYALSTTNFKTENYMAKVMVFVGYRFNFNSRKILKKLKLIDY